MKINLIGMILNNCGRKAFDQAIIGDDKKPLSAANSLHVMIMEYTERAFNGGKSDVVGRSREVTIAQPLCSAGVPR